MEGVQNSTIMRIGNSGSAPATNVSLTLLTNPLVKITKLTMAISSSELFLKENHTKIKNQESTYVNNSVLELYMPKLAQGTGSLIPLELFFEKPVPSIVQVSVVYNQGSIGVRKGGNIEEDLISYWDTYETYFNILFALIFVVIFAYVIYFVWIQKKTRFISRLINELLEVRRKLLSNSMTKESLTIHWPKVGLRKIGNVKDYIIVDDLFTKLTERNKNINTDVHEFNQECLDSVNKALDIKWDKYR